MSDAWDEIQAIKSKRNSLRERLEKRKKERQDILGTTSSNSGLVASPTNLSNIGNISILQQSNCKPEPNEIFTADENGLFVFLDLSILFGWLTTILTKIFSSSTFLESDPEIERLLLQILSDSALLLPINSVQLIEKISLLRFKPVTINTLSYFLQKLATQSYIR